jgi:uncharacterized protein YndB with AHSA1/START domain
VPAGSRIRAAGAQHGEGGGRKSSTDSAVPVTGLIFPRVVRIWMTVTMNGGEVACSRPRWPKGSMRRWACGISAAFSSTRRQAVGNDWSVAVDVVTEIVIDRPCAEVAGYAADPTHAPQWDANIESIEWRTEPPVRVGSRMDFVARFLGRRLAYTYQVVELVPGNRLVMRTAQGPFPMETSYTWEAVDAGRTRMTLRNRGEPSGFGKLAAPVLAAAMRRANDKDLATIKRILEGGQPVSPA